MARAIRGSASAASFGLTATHTRSADAASSGDDGRPPDVAEGRLDGGGDGVGQRQAVRQPTMAAHEARGEGAAHRADADDRHPGRPGGRRASHQYWLKKPFSSRRARSSADTSTLRGVSMKTLSATRCMPPSRA